MHKKPLNISVPKKMKDRIPSLYEYNDFSLLQDRREADFPYFFQLSSIDELLDRDKQREKDGFPRKIRLGKLIKPGQGKRDKIIVVPTTVEEKFIHDTSPPDPEGEQSKGGSGQGEEGEVIGQQPVKGQEKAGEQGAGQGESGAHEMESSAYELGKILTEKFELPNLKDKGKKRSFTKYTYDLTDRHPGRGQIIDKKATLKKIIKTNIALGRITGRGSIDPSELMVSPREKIFRILSKEKDYESQAVVFFVRDYSGSMQGPPTDLVVSQHILIYSWLLYQYARQVETRFVLHDTEAKEVPDFLTYYRYNVAGGTRIASALQLINEIVQQESLYKDYNIYIFYGTDGDDWDSLGEKSLPELHKMVKYANRIGITVTQPGYRVAGNSDMEKYIEKSKFLEEYPKVLRMDSLEEDSDEPRLIEGIKKLISE